MPKGVNKGWSKVALILCPPLVVILKTSSGFNLINLLIGVSAGL